MSVLLTALQAEGEHAPVLQGLDLEKVLTYAGIGAAWAIVGFGNSRAKGTAKEFSYQKSGQTVLIGAIAGVIVAMHDQSPTAANFEAAMALAVPLTNQIVNWVKYSGRDLSQTTTSNQ